MWQHRLYCPSCKATLYEYDFQLEGEVSCPEQGQPFQCDSCHWIGAFGELSQTPPLPAPPEIDYQI